MLLRGNVTHPMDKNMNITITYNIALEKIQMTNYKFQQNLYNNKFYFVLGSTRSHFLTRGMCAYLDAKLDIQKNIKNINKTNF